MLEMQDSIANWEEVPTLALWMNRYEPGMKEILYHPSAVEAQKGLMGMLFLSHTGDLRYCIDSGVTAKWFGVLVFAAAADAILSLPGVGGVDIDICTIRDALVDADCLGDRPYQIPLSGWVDLAAAADTEPVDWHVDNLAGIYEAEAVRLRRLKAEGKIQ